MDQGTGRPIQDPKKALRNATFAPLLDYGSLMDRGLKTRTPLNPMEGKPLPAELDFLRDPDLESSLVGSTALWEACRREGLALPPTPKDLDVAWRLDTEAGRKLLQARGIEVTATQGNLDRGTLGANFEGFRVEFTTYRGGGNTAKKRIQADAALRDMTIGALFWTLWNNEIVDPLHGLEDWRQGVIRACGDPKERILEHPIRALRYIRKVTILGFHLDTKTRKAIRALRSEIALGIHPDALAGEIRSVLADADSPGVFFQMCAEELLLERLLPELAPLFHGIPAGRVRHHPEISQALHMILVLKSAVALAKKRRLDPNNRHKLLMAALCHDLGKGVTPIGELPSHPAHETTGIAQIQSLFDRLPGIGSKTLKRLVQATTRRHLLIDKLATIRNGTLVRLWEDDLAAHRKDLPLFATLVRCDKEGRMSPQDLGLPTPPGHPPSVDWDAFEARMSNDLLELDRILRAVSGEESAKLHPNDPAAIKKDLHERRCRALKKAKLWKG